MSKKQLIILIIVAIIVIIVANVLMTVNNKPQIMAPGQDEAPIVYDVS